MSLRLVSILMFVIVYTLSSRTQFADETSSDEGLIWSGGMGLSYPLLVSVSAGTLLPLAQKLENNPYAFPGVIALHANLDVGLAGAMISGGFSFPVKAGYGSSAVSIKLAALRTWLLDIGVGRNRTFNGVVTELLVASHPDAKVGLGYFEDRYHPQQAHDNFVFVYLGVGI